jgi:hypothetical protein
MAEKHVQKCRLISGINIAPRTAADARALIGKSVMYLRNQDVDKSGRGHLSPQFGVIAAIHGRNVAMDEPNNFVFVLSDLKEMVELKSFTCSIESEADWNRFHNHCRAHGIVIRSRAAIGQDGEPTRDIASATAIEFVTGATIEDMLEAVSLAKSSDLMRATLKEGCLSTGEPTPSATTPTAGI